MSKGELGRVEALARVRSKQLRLVDAARLIGCATDKRSGCGGDIGRKAPQV